MEYQNYYYNPRVLFSRAYSHFTTYKKQSPVLSSSNVIKYGDIASGYVYSITEGLSFGKQAYQVSVVRYNHEKAYLHHAKTRTFMSLTKAQEYILFLKKTL